MPELNPTGNPEVVGLKAGTNDNYTQIEPDGTIKLVGDATVWCDLVGSLVASRLESVVGALSYNYDNNSITMDSGGNIGTSIDRLIFNFQYPHGAVTNGEMRLHIHWEQVDAVDREFTVQYRIQKNGQTKEETWTTVVVQSGVNNKFAYTSGTLGQITELVHVDMTGAGLSPTVQFRLARTDAVAGSIEATFVDAHVEEDTMGSRQEYVK